MRSDICRKLQQLSASCIISNGQQERVFHGRGVSDLYTLLNEEPLFLSGSLVIDKVVGKAAAALLIKGGVKELHTPLISTLALGLFQKSQVKVFYDTEVPYIINRTHTDSCPLEKLCRSTDDLEELCKIITRFIG